MTNNPPSAQIKPGEYGFPLKLKARYCTDPKKLDS